MTTKRAQTLVDDYLARLKVAAAVLPPDRRAELVEGIAEHLDAAQAAGEASDEADLREVLDRLGSPEAIVIAELAESGGHVARPAPPTWGLLEIAGITLLALGGFAVPVLAPLLGMAFVVASDRWTARQKMVAAVIAFLPAAILILTWTNLVQVLWIWTFTGWWVMLVMAGPSLAAAFLCLFRRRR